MEFKILGPLEVLDDDRPVRLGGPKPRALLALLLLRGGQVVSIDELIDALWAEHPPKTAEHSVQVYVSELRKALADDPAIVLARRAQGYALEKPPESLDAHRFTRLAERGRAAATTGDHAAGATALREALDLWRGPALADFAFEDWARIDIDRLEESRLGAIEDRIEADLALGRYADVIAELQALVDANPGRERLRASLMLALYQSGQQAEAVQEFHRARARLADELGIDPGPALADLAARILAQDPTLAAPTPQRPRARTPAVDEPLPERSTRRIVSVLVADISMTGAGGAPLDPESSWGPGMSAADIVRTVAKRHGATMREHAGGIVVALFGVPRSHEDDALRAVRAAVEIREQLADVGDDRAAVRAVLGIATGEAVTGGDAEEFGADLLRRARQVARTTDAVTADATTIALVRDAVTVEPKETGAFLVVEVHERAPAPSRRIDSPIVGRDGELAELARTIDRVAAHRAAMLLTISGDAGIGKTRLVEEFAHRVRESATVLVGRCLSYGEGITYWPIAEAIRQVAQIHEDDDAPTVRKRIEALLVEDADRDRIIETLGHILGIAEVDLSPGDVLWSIRRLVEALADRPLVLVIEDLHWAEPTLLDLLESVVDWMRDAPLLVLATARPDLFDRRPAWGGGRSDAATMSLRPLAPDDTDRLIENLVRHPGLDADAKAKIVATAEGNPLFVEQLLSMMIDDGLIRSDDGSWSLAADLSGVSLPTSLQTLLAARLDRLPVSQRDVLGIASVIGRTFDAATVDALADGGLVDVSAILTELVRRDLIRPERTPNGDAFRFRHVLIMQAMYETLPKRSRAALHEAAADLLEATVGEQTAGYDELVGDHLARAAGYRAELGDAGADLDALRQRAGHRLASAGRRAYVRGDMPAAVSLLSTARLLLPNEDLLRLRMLPDLGAALIEIGRMEEADDVLNEAIDLGTERGDMPVVADALFFRYEGELWRHLWDRLDVSVEHARRLVAMAEASGDDLVQQRGWHILASSADTWAEQNDRIERAIGFAERAHDRKGLHESIQFACELLESGPLAVREGLRRSEHYQTSVGDDRLMQAAIVVMARAVLLSMAGDTTRFRDEYRSARDTFRDLGLTLWLNAGGTAGPAWAELIGGNFLAAEALSREGVEGLDRIEPSPRLWLTQVLELHARSLLLLGRSDEAARDLERLASIARPQDPFFRSVRAGLAVQRGDTSAAVTDLREALDGMQRNWVREYGTISMDLAEALRADGQEADARRQATITLEMFERKGDVASAARARAFVEA